MRILIPVIISSMIFTFSVNGSPSLKSELSDEHFMNRLRYTGEYTRLSLLLSINDQGFDWAEPSFVSPVISAGRIELKGLPRELSNPDGTAPGSSVYGENSRAGITDSFGRSSRFGITAGTAVSSWIFRTNSGMISAGTVSTVCSFKYLEADAYFSAATSPESTADSWFADYSVMPEQICFNAAAELRAGSRLPVTDAGKNAGRKIMRFEAPDNRAAASFLAGISIPEYTRPGYFLRAVFNAGCRSSGIRGLFQWVGDEYLPPVGKSPSYRISTGFSAHTGVFSNRLDTVFSCGYFYRQRKPEVLPGKVIAQSREIDAGIKLEAGIFNFNFNAAGSLNHNINDCMNADADFDAIIKISSGPVISSLSGGMDFEDIRNSIQEKTAWYCGVCFRVKKEPFDCCFDYVYRDEKHHITPGIRITAPKGRFDASMNIIDGCIAGFSSGFQSE